MIDLSNKKKPNRTLSWYVKFVVDIWYAWEWLKYWFMSLCRMSHQYLAKKPFKSLSLVFGAFFLYAYVILS